MRTVVCSVHGEIMLSNFFTKNFAKFGPTISAGPSMGVPEIKTILREEKKQLFKSLDESKIYIKKLFSRLYHSDFKTPSGEVDSEELFSKVATNFKPELIFWVDTNALFLKNIEYLKDKCLTAAYIFNTHMSSEIRKKRLDYAKNFDFVFLAFKNDLKEFSEINENVYWLPVAFEPNYYYKKDSKKIYDWCFIGQTNPEYHPSRMDLLNHLLKNNDLKGFVGTAFLEDANKLFNSSKVCLNKSMNNDLNMRVFEILGSGNLLITDQLTEDTGFSEMFQNKKHLLTYREDAEDLISFYTKNDYLREKIALTGLKEAFEKHTYSKRVEDILQIIKKKQQKYSFSFENIFYITWVKDENELAKLKDSFGEKNIICLINQDKIKVSFTKKVIMIKDTDFINEISEIIEEKNQSFRFLNLSSLEYSEKYAPENFKKMFKNETERIEIEKTIHFIESIIYYLPKDKKIIILLAKKQMLMKNYQKALFYFKLIINETELIKELAKDIRFCIKEIEATND